MRTASNWMVCAVHAGEDGRLADVHSAPSLALNDHPQRQKHPKFPSPSCEITVFSAVPVCNRTLTQVGEVRGRVGADEALVDGLGAEGVDPLGVLLEVVLEALAEVEASLVEAPADGRVLLLLRVVRCPPWP